MMVQRQRYTSFPWNEEAKKRKKKAKRQNRIDHLILDVFFFLLGAFAAIMVISYYPLPWGQ